MNPRKDACQSVGGRRVEKGVVAGVRCADTRHPRHLIISSLSRLNIIGRTEDESLLPNIRVINDK